MNTPTLIISGPVGVGKSSVANEISNVLCDQKIAHTLVDLDALTQTYPRPSDDPYGTGLAIRNLLNLWQNAKTLGSRNLIIARVIEQNSEISEIGKVVPDANFIVCQLQAKDETLVKRISQREIGSGKVGHIERALKLSASLRKSAPANITIETDEKTVVEIAKEIASLVRWLTD